jgi:ankyrin repeat protein
MTSKTLFPGGKAALAVLKFSALPLILGFFAWNFGAGAGAQEFIIRDPLGFDLELDRSKYFVVNPRMKGRKVPKIDDWDSFGYTELINAIESGNMGKLRRILKQGANPNIQDVKGNSPIQWADRRRCLECAKLLIQRGADVSEEIPETFSDPNIIQYLKKHGLGRKAAQAKARIQKEREKELRQDRRHAVLDYDQALEIKDILERYKKTGELKPSIPLYVILGEPLKNIVELHNNGADINEVLPRFGTALQISVGQNHPEEEVITFLELGADPNQTVSILNKNKLMAFELIDKDMDKAFEKIVEKGFDLKTHGTDALSVCADQGKTRLVDFLLAKGVPVSHKGKAKTNPPFISAARSARDTKTLRNLLNAGADPNTKDESGRNAIANMTWSEANTPVIIFLMEAGTSAKDPSILKSHGQTLIHYAVKTKNKELFTAAVKAGAPVKARDKRQESALHMAVTAGDPWFTRELLKAGAPVNGSVYSSGDMYADYTGIHRGTDDLLAEAVTKGKNLEVVEILLNAGVNKNVKANEYDQGTALHLAIARNRLEMAKAIVKAGASLSATDRYKRTPLHIAAFHENKDMIELLIGAGANVNAKDIDGQKPEDYLYGVKNYRALIAPFNNKKQ